MQLKLQSPKIYLWNAPVDFRKAMDGLLELVKTQGDFNVRESVFIFYNCNCKKLKLLAWHGNGFVLLYKRLEQGRFTVQIQADGLIGIDEKQLSWLLAGLDWYSMSHWNELEFDNFY